MTCSAIVVTDGPCGLDVDVSVGVELGAEPDDRCVATWITE
jgi:hypothetical protein